MWSYPGAIIKSPSAPAYRTGASWHHSHFLSNLLFNFVHARALASINHLDYVPQCLIVVSSPASFSFRNCASRCGRHAPRPSPSPTKNSTSCLPGKITCQNLLDFLVHKILLLGCSTNSPAANPPRLTIPVIRVRTQSTCLAQ